MGGTGGRYLDREGGMTTDLRALVRAGDREAFGELFDRYARTVYNHGFRLTADWALADDVVSGTFLEAWRVRERVDPDGGSLRPWLLGIATNISRNLRRGDRRYRAAALASAQLDQVTPDHAGIVNGRVDELGSREELIFDRHDYTFLGQRSVRTTDTDGIKAGTVTFSSAILARSRVNALKETP
jgi:DNA-directed RNA polymerase specialized sigma24 family protein